MSDFLRLLSTSVPASRLASSGGRGEGRGVVSVHSCSRRESCFFCGYCLENKALFVQSLCQDPPLFPSKPTKLKVPILWDSMGHYSSDI